MTHMEMTVHEALCKLKVLVKRINPNGDWVVAAKASDKKIGGVDIMDVKADIISRYDEVTALIKEMNAIKKAISKYNAETIINVAGIEMSVAEAIYMKDFGINYDKSLLQRLKESYSITTKAISRFNGEDLDARTEKFISATFGSKEKASADEIEKAMKMFKENNSFVLIDPLKIQEKIKELEDRITAFDASVDSAIQIANATHVIAIDI